MSCSPNVISLTVAGAFASFLTSMLKVIFMNVGASMDADEGGERAASSHALFIVGSLFVHGLLVALLSAAPRPVFAPPSPPLNIDVAFEASPPAPVVETPPPPEPEPVVARPRATPIAQEPVVAAAPAPAVAPAEPAPPVMATALPTDSNGDLAMNTGGGPANATVLGTHAQEGASVGRVDGVAPAPVAAAPEVDRRALLRDWTRSVSRVLAERARRHYPRSALQSHHEGTVLLAITVDSHGHVSEVHVAQSSGHDTLDEAALAVVQDVADVPEPPAALAWQTRAMPMPIVYSLR